MYITYSEAKFLSSHVVVVVIIMHYDSHVSQVNNERNLWIPLKIQSNCMNCYDAALLKPPFHGHQIHPNCCQLDKEGKNCLVFR